jgi:hypothetical protein
MNRKEIHFIIDREGNVQSTIKGIKGSACSLLAAEFEELGQVIGQQPTGDFYETVNSTKIRLDLNHKISKR